jgi:HK97 family phage prohead protease
MSATLMATPNSDHFTILKSDELMIGGYASIEIVDKQNDLITLKALNEAVNKYMENPKYRNVMTNHSNVQVGEVVKSYRDKSGKLWKTEVDDVGFFVVIKLREDIEKAKEINRGIRKGSLRSFSIGGQAIHKVKKNHPDLGDYNEISKLELHEVTICEKGINPEAKFDILKQEKQKKEAKNMSKLEKALAELDTLMEEVNVLRKEDEKDDGFEAAMPEMDKEEYMDEEEVSTMGGDYNDDKNAAVLSTLDGAGVEIGEPANRLVISGGKPTSSDMPVVKAFGNEEMETLDLSVGNIEKAYEAFRQEQLEKLAYDNLQKQFENRFESEVGSRETLIAKANYDAQNEIASLKEEFTLLRKSLTAEKDTILKAQEESAVQLPSMDEMAEMDWSDIHKMVGGY